MIDKTHAVVLRIAPSGNTSRVVTWLTPAHGRVTTILKGALRPKNLFLGQYDLFYTCELLYYRKDINDLHIARECAPIKPRPSLRHNWRACAYASYFTDLTMRISPSRAPQSFVYQWLGEALDELDQHGFDAEVCHWFELKLLDQLGLAPSMEKCMGCRSLLHNAQPASFSPSRGGLLCGACARNDPKPALPVPADVRALLRHWQRAGTPAHVRRVKSNERQRTLVDRILGDFMQYHLDLPLTARTVATQIGQR